MGALVVKTTARHISTPGAMKRDETINTVPRVYIVCKMSCYHLVLAVTRSQSLYIRIIIMYNEIHFVSQGREGQDCTILPLYPA